MGKIVVHTARQLILWIIALQILNLSVGSAFTWDNGYDYSYGYNETYDPTETAVEWIVELNYGQQPAFSYDTHQDGAKCLIKTFHWKTDLQRSLPEPGSFPVIPVPHVEYPTRHHVSPVTELVSPPPECLPAA